MFARQIRWESLEARGLRPTHAEIKLTSETTDPLKNERIPGMAEYTFLNVHDSRSIIFGGVAVAPN
jgi:hypothetical protein